MFFIVVYKLIPLLQQESLQNYKLATANAVISSDTFIGLNDIDSLTKNAAHSGWYCLLSNHSSILWTS